VSDAALKTISINEVGIPFSVCAVGPSGFVNFMGDPTVNGTVAYASPIVVASTWNVDLAEAQGNMVGNEGILGDQTRAVPVSYTGWYAPAMNIHRSPFSGRNNEYYSEDGLLSGLMASSVIKGATNKGVITFIKHFAVNDQETHRDRNGLVTWLDEQCMREIYLKPFELSVKKGGSLGIMSSFNRIGTVWTGGDYDLLTEILRNEWGFRGSVITDFNLTNYMDVTQMVLAGGDLNLSNTKSLTYTDYTDATFATALRNAAHNTLYALANSNAMNGYGGDVIYRDGWTPWQQALLIIDLVVVAAIGTWGGLVIAISLKKIKH
jgi:beta-glucosidase